MGSEKPLGTLRNTKLPDPEFVSPAELCRLQKLEQALKGAILKADIRFGPEHFVTAFNRFYDEQLDVRNNSGPSLKGKQANLERLRSFLTPIHVVVKAGRGAALFRDGGKLD